MRTLARWCFVHRRIVLLGWVLALVGITALHSAAGSAYTDNFKLPHTQSFDAVSLLQRNAPKASGDTDQIVIAVRHGRVTDPATRARVQTVLSQIAAQPHVSSVQSPYSAQGASQISPSGQIAFANVTFDVQPNKISNNAAKAFVSKVTSAVEQRPAVPGRRADRQGGQPQQRFQRPRVRLPGCGGRAVRRVRLGPGDGPAAADGRHVARNRDRGRRAALARDEHGLVLERAVAADRPRRRRRLRPVHRHALPAGAAARADRRGGGRRIARHLWPCGPVRRADRLHRDARDVRARRELPVRRRGGGVDRGRVHGACGADAAAGAARLLRAASCFAGASAARCARAG